MPVYGKSAGYPHLAVSANEEAALAGVDTETGEGVNLDLLYS